MKYRNPAAVLLLPFVTLGIYSLYWAVSTKNEMNRQGAEIPTAWLIIVPFVNIWWDWKYSEGVERITGGKLTNIMSFLLLFALGNIGQAIIQHDFNTHSAAVATGQVNAPQNPVAPVAPATNTPTPINPVAPTAPAAPQVAVSPEQQPPANPTI